MPMCIVINNRLTQKYKPRTSIHRSTIFIITN